MEVNIPEELKKRFPDTSITDLKNGKVRILCSSHPIYSGDTVDKVAKELVDLNPDLEHDPLAKRMNRHGIMEGILVFKEK